MVSPDFLNSRNSDLHCTHAPETSARACTAGMSAVTPAPAATLQASMAGEKRTPAMTETAAER